MREPEIEIQGHGHGRKGNDLVEAFMLVVDADAKCLTQEHGNGNLCLVTARGIDRAGLDPALADDGTQLPCQLTQPLVAEALRIGILQPGDGAGLHRGMASSAEVSGQQTGHFAPVLSIGMDEKHPEALGKHPSAGKAGNGIDLGAEQPLRRVKTGQDSPERRKVLLDKGPAQIAPPGVGVVQSGDHFQIAPQTRANGADEDRGFGHDQFFPLVMDVEVWERAVLSIQLS